ncbi:F-box only protein 21-like [Pectinophora gossypiella]|uniref:F-box domain-containing protein n=1 Tax=Pectinophora gossypiella TaxID=13191 RepID=A0A1E1WUG7_PECGO|nr:F-box only protein 21-like [Pectinophora gossypiella]
MEENVEEEKCTINSLPDEIISLVLLNNDYRDIVSFGSTCKRFNELVQNDQTLWKLQFKRTLPVDLIENVKSDCETDWLAETKRYFTLKQQLYAEVILMSPKLYRRSPDISLTDIEPFFELALSHNLNYYYTIHILQSMVKFGSKNLGREPIKKPYTLTDIHYAKIVLRHLMHTFLAFKWVKMHHKDELSPERVVNFFIQWTDTDLIYVDEEVDNEVLELVKKVEDLLEKPSKSRPGDTVKELCAEGVIKERQVLEAISQVIYSQRRMATVSTANVDTLNIMKVLSGNCGNVIAIGSVYNAVAKIFGINCELIAFPNHLFLEWRDCSERQPKLYTIELATGDIHPKRRCPFSQGGPVSTYKYYADSLLQYIYSVFHASMGAIKNWHTQNSLHLLDFLGTDNHEYNPYKNFLPYLLDLTHLPAMNMPLDLKYLDSSQIQIIRSLTNLNAPFNTALRDLVVKNHNSRVTYAAGMICYHKKYDYTCIVRGWDVTCAVEWQEIDTLEFANQPFYHVIAADQSERYVAQENLQPVPRPCRLYHLEDFIAREFSHFDGFAYVPNSEKIVEYPDEAPITNTYRNHNHLRAAPPRP